MPKYRSKPETIEAHWDEANSYWVVEFKRGYRIVLTDREFKEKYEQVPDDPFASPFAHMNFFDDPIQRRGLGTFSED